MALRVNQMVNDAEWFTKDKQEKVRINSIKIYKDLSSEIVKKLDDNLPVSEIISWIQKQTIQACKARYSKSPSDGALNNSVGRWNEFIATSLFSEIVLDINHKNEFCVAIFSLPNSQVQKEGSVEASSKILSLFNNDEFTNGKSLSKLLPFKERIFLPSPDYIITVIHEKEIAEPIQPLLKEQARKPNSLAIYNFLKGKLQIQEIKAIVSLKTSNRPDRRYQPLFEAAIIKAMNYVLHQNWKYYMVASELSSADKTIFSTAIAPHSIALEQNFRLVDCTYLYNRKEDLVPLVESALQS
jgi:hypothetical protein